MHFIQLILHLDQYLTLVIKEYHNYFYVIMFCVIFCETGLVVTPFLPGDSLLFVAGGLAARNSLNFPLLVVIIFAAAFLGDNSNFFIGKFLGHVLFKNPKSKIFRHDILNRTHNFYERHGHKTVILARFIPFVRTFVPFVAGIGRMRYLRFICFSLIGTFFWVLLFLYGGFLFCHLPIIKNHLSLIILVVMLVSIIPIAKLLINEFTSAKSHK